MSSGLTIPGSSMDAIEVSLEANESDQLHSTQDNFAPIACIYGSREQWHKPVTSDLILNKESIIAPKRSRQLPNMPINDLLYPTTKYNYIQQPRLNTVNNACPNFIDDKFLFDRALSDVIGEPDSSILSAMIDPLPLPPNHIGNFHLEQNRDEIGDRLQNAPVSPVLSHEVKNHQSPITLSGQHDQQQNARKHNRDMYTKNVIEPGVSPPFHRQISIEADGDLLGIAPLSCGSSNVKIRPLKRRKTNSEENFRTTSSKEILAPNLNKLDSIVNPPESILLMAMDCDDDYLSEYQCLVRQQIEIFEATAEDVESRDRGRNSAIVLGQVGIRCKYCARLPAKLRPRGASYYTSTLSGLYQAAQKMTADHFFNHCRLIPESIKASLIILKQDRKRASDGKRYWAEGARSLGIRETPKMGLRLIRRSTDERAKAKSKSTF